jgi:hypothetical protein
MSSPTVNFPSTNVNVVLSSAQNAGAVEYMSPVRTHWVRLVELESSLNEKYTAAGFGLPVVGVKVEKPLMVNVVGEVHVSLGRSVGKADVGERDERMNSMIDDVYILGLDCYECETLENILQVALYSDCANLIRAYKIVRSPETECFLKRQRKALYP